jgi:hypothetical protein
MGVKYDAVGLSSEKERQPFPAAKNVRRSERILISLPISVSGKVEKTQRFFKEGRTLGVSRYGATIAVDLDFRAGQNLIIQCADANEQAEAQVVEKIKDQPQGHVYGIKLLEPADTLWGITFPPFVESQKAVVRVLLRCITCRQLEVAYLNDFDTKGFVAHCSLARFCFKCSNWTTWNRPYGEMLTAPSFPLRPESQGQNSGAVLEPDDHDKRSHERIRLDAIGCIRHPPLGDEIVLVVDLAPGGVRFCSANKYAEGAHVELATPYSSKAPNIFAPARIVSYKKCPENTHTEYGLAYTV